MVYFVLVDFGPRLGKAWAERDVSRTNKRDTIADILSGGLQPVVQVIELNHVEFSSRDVTEDIMNDVKHEAAIHWCNEIDLVAERRDQQRDHNHKLRVEA